MMAAPLPSNVLLVACLCAQWCSSCRDYRATFDQVAAAFPQARFMWIDIEDQADLVDPIEVENFPTLLIASHRGALFLGPLTPHKETLVRMLQTHLGAKDAAALPDSETQALARRLWEERP